MRKQKVFGIGFHKTGTTSLQHALTRLGYRVTGPNGYTNPNISRDVYDMAFSLAHQYDAFQDNPWPILFREMDARYPQSKFVLTLRPTEDWIRSVVRHFGSTSTPMRKWIYGVGVASGNEDIYTARYERHNREVLEYFKDRPGDLLVMQITNGDGWEELCPFLGKRIPSVPFPHSNNANDRGRTPSDQAPEASFFSKVASALSRR